MIKFPIFVDAKPENLLKIINTILKKYYPVTLEEANDVKLMNRIDRKYWFHISKLNPLLENALEYYNVLEINGQRLMEYETTYFDTGGDTMYIKHHNSKLNRHKIRQRRYTSTDSSFLEIKYKTNKKRTIKKRIEADFNSPRFKQTELDFIDEKTPFQGKNLQPTLNNRFQRITLIHKEKLDRCTIDISPVFWNDNGNTGFENLVIFEIKRGRSLKSSPIVLILRRLKIKQRGLSKYCTGRAFLDPHLKQNAFKPRLRFLQNEIFN